jgi:V8-like Glu-specific endopeptidase
VFDKNNGNSAFKNWTIYPGCNGLDGNGNPIYYGTACGWDKVYYSSKWMETHSDQYDWAICVLQSDVGNQLGWLGIQSYGVNSEMNNLPVRVYGYPQDANAEFYSDARYQYVTGDKITSVGDRYFRYSGSLFHGFSGGPIVRTSDNFIVGIHVGLVWNTPTGVRITQEMIDIIRNLR